MRLMMYRVAVLSAAISVFSAQPGWTWRRRFKHKIAVPATPILSSQIPPVISQYTGFF